MPLAIHSSPLMTLVRLGALCLVCLFCPGAAPLLAQALPAAQNPVLEAQVATILAEPAVSRAHWGISVVDAASGAKLYGHEDGQFFEPASNAKLFTTTAAFALLGPSYTMKTSVVAEGKITGDGHLRGVLRLIGGADPSLSGRSYPYVLKTDRPYPPLHALDELATQVAASGIRKVDGSVVGDDTLFVYERYGSGWAWDDLQWEYGAPASALTINDNVRYLTLTPGANPGDPVTASWNPDLATAFVPGMPAAAASAGGTALSPPAPPAPTAVAGGVTPPDILLSAITSPAGTEAHLGVSREVDGSQLRVFGTLAARSQPVSRAISIEDPAAYAAQAFTAALRAHGVEVSGQSQPAHRVSSDTAGYSLETHQPVTLLAAPGRALPSPASETSAASSSIDAQGFRVVAARLSPPLSDLITVTNKVSQNLHAEMLLRLLGRAQGDDGSVAQGVRVVRQFAITAGVDPEDFTFYDGSGLSGKDLVTPRAVTTLLTYAARQPWGAAYRATLPVGGVDGTLAGRFLQPALRGKVTAKTGTLAQVNALSGYLTGASGRMLAFSILCNDQSGDSSRAAMDRIVAAIAAAE